MIRRLKGVLDEIGDDWALIDVNGVGYQIFCSSRTLFQFAVGESGATGPTGNSYGDPPGHTCIALVGPVSQAMTLETGSNVRKTNMWRFAEETILFAQRTIAEIEKLC